MGIGRHFTTTIKPTIKASNQKIAFAAGDILFDWTEFRIPRGAARLLNIVALIRGTNGADQDLLAGSDLDIELFFAKKIEGVAPTTLGDINGAVDTPGWFNHLIGMQYLDMSANNIGSSTGLVYMSMAQMANRGGGPDLVLATEDHPTNLGYDTYYIAGLSSPTGAGTFDFSTNVETTALYDMSSITEATVSSLDDGAAGASAVANKFAVGDIIHDEDDVVLGEISSIGTNALTFRTDGVKQIHAGGITLYNTPANLAAYINQNGTGATDGDVAANKELYNLNPITIKLSFEK
tara:strand:+ start:39 stop:917 length:879 start_codon:yes stop_codon:yes gene_type:complete